MKKILFLCLLVLGCEDLQLDEKALILLSHEQESYIEYTVDGVTKKVDAKFEYFFGSYMCVTDEIRIYVICDDLSSFRVSYKKGMFFCNGYGDFIIEIERWGGHAKGFFYGTIKDENYVEHEIEAEFYLLIGPRTPDIVIHGV